MLEQPRKVVLTSTCNLYFGAKIRKIGIPLLTPVLLYKSGVQRGILFMDKFPDDSLRKLSMSIIVTLLIILGNFKRHIRLLSDMFVNIRYYFQTTCLRI